MRTPFVNRFATPPWPEPTQEEIGLWARFIWEEEGCPQGRALDHWLLAEMRLRQGCQADAGTGMRPRPRRSGRPAFTWSEPGVVAV